MHINGEYYHIYNRGAHKTPIFNDHSDYVRFMSTMVACNTSTRLKAKWYATFSWKCDDSDRLVDIFSFCLMPNHYHLGIIQVAEGGIERYIRALCTSYAMYFNFKYKHSGTIFQGKYKSKHVDNDEYLRYLIQYIHLNPYGIEEPDLTNEAKRDYTDEAFKYSKNYTYSSLKDYLGVIRNENIITIRGRTSRSDLGQKI